MLLDDYKQSDTECPQCGNLMIWRYCQEANCNDGIISDDDDLGGEVTSYHCPTCKGTGIEQWCQNCNYGVD